MLEKWSQDDADIAATDEMVNLFCALSNLKSGSGRVSKKQLQFWTGKVTATYQGQIKMEQSK